MFSSQCTHLQHRSLRVQQPCVKPLSLHNAAYRNHSVVHAPRRIPPHRYGQSNAAGAQKTFRHHPRNDHGQRPFAHILHSMYARPRTVHARRQQSESAAARRHPDGLPQLYAHAEAQLAQGDLISAHTTAAGLASTDGTIRSQGTVQGEELISDKRFCAWYLMCNMLLSIR